MKNGEEKFIRDRRTGDQENGVSDLYEAACLLTEGSGQKGMVDW